MKKIQFNSGLYDVAIIDGNLELQSITETILFPNGGTELTEDAERAFFQLRYAGQRLNSFVSDYMDDMVQYYVDTHKEIAQVITHSLN